MERSGEYLTRGDYHRHLDRRWAHYPIYVEKIRMVERILEEISPTARILDLGCGEGLLVERFRARGYNIQGVDLNYESDCVRKGNLLQLPEQEGSVDVVLALDVIEHLNFADQERGVREIQRVLKPGGRFIVTTPNLAHLSSRLVFLLTGRLLRTSSIERHPGDRPMQEYKQLFGKSFEIRRVRGIFPTFPISSLLTLAFPAAMLWWHRILNATCAYSPWCFLNLYDCRKRM